MTSRISEGLRDAMTFQGGDGSKSRSMVWFGAIDPENVTARAERPRGASHSRQRNFRRSSSRISSRADRRLSRLRTAAVNFCGGQAVVCSFGSKKTGMIRTLELSAETMNLLKDHKKHQVTIKMRNRRHITTLALCSAKGAGDLQSTPTHWAYCFKSIPSASASSRGSLKRRASAG